MKSFDVTIPVLNEEATLETNVKTLHQFIRKNFPGHSRWRIVIADNGSTDKTREIARRLAEDISEVQFLSVPQKGVGLALKTSWSQSDADIVGYMDLDLATDLEHFLEVYRAIDKEDYDLVYGSRLHPRSTVVNRPLKREVASRVFNWLLKAYLGVRFSDGMCGFKFLQRKWYDQLHRLGAENDGWFFSTELLTVGEWVNLKIYELPITWTDDTSSSKVKIMPLARKYIRSMIALKKKKPQKIA